MQSITFTSRAISKPCSSNPSVKHPDSGQPAPQFSGFSGQAGAVRLTPRPFIGAAALLVAALALVGCGTSQAPEAPEASGGSSSQQAAEVFPNQLTPDQMAKAKAKLADLEQRFRPENLKSIQWQQAVPFENTKYDRAILTTLDGQQYKLFACLEARHGETVKTFSVSPIPWPPSGSCL
jgi:hypothetical protein